MKYLNRFNESNSSIIDRDYMSECFMNIIDHYDSQVGVCKGESDAYDDELNEWSIHINLPHIKYSEDKWVIIRFNNDILEDTIIKSKKLIDLYEEIKASIDKVKLNYSELDIQYYVESESFNNDYNNDSNYEDAYIIVNFTL